MPLTIQYAIDDKADDKNHSVTAALVYVVEKLPVPMHVSAMGKKPCSWTSDGKNTLKPGHFSAQYHTHEFWDRDVADDRHPSSLSPFLKDPLTSRSGSRPSTRSAAEPAAEFELSTAQGIVLGILLALLVPYVGYLVCEHFNIG